MVVVVFIVHDNAQRIWLCIGYEGADPDLLLGLVATDLDRLSLVPVSNQHAGFYSEDISSNPHF